MDKPRDVRHGPSRFSTAKLRIKQSRRRLFGGLDGTSEDIEFPEKSKKGKVRRLSAVGRALSSFEDYKMGCDVAEKVGQSPSLDIIASSNRYKNKIPKKFFYDCDGVDHGSVPRKLRSAMKKRYREYDLPDSEKRNHKLNGIESPEKDGTKKIRVNSKQGSPNWSPKQTVSRPITKDEEEVVETLYALAGMFPNSDSNDRSKSDSDSLPENSVLQDLEKSSNAAFEAPETSRDASPSCAERSPGEAAKKNSLDETIGQNQPDLVENAKSLIASDSVAPKLNLQNMPKLVRSGNCNEVALNDFGLSLAMGLNTPRQSSSLDIEMKPEMAVEMARAYECKREHHMIKDNNKNDDPTLWPGLSLAVSARSDDSNMQSYAAKAPLWLDHAICASKQDLTQRCSSDGKISGIDIHKKSWKSCAAHVHICNLIRSLQVPNGKDTLLLQQPNQSNQLRANEGSTHGVPMEVQNLNRMRCEIASVTGTGHSDTSKDSHETKNSTLQQPHRFHDISPEAPALDVFGPQKQSFNSLRLSSGVNRSKVNNKFDKGGGSMLKLQIPYFQPPAQQHVLVRFPVPQTQYASTSYPDQISVVPQQILHRYHGNPFWGTPNSTTASIKQQQQNFWPVQVAAQGQGRSGVNCNIIRAHNPNGESGNQDNCVVTRGPSMVLHSSPSLQMVGSKFSQISEQHQQLIALASSLSHSRTNGLEFHFSM